MISAGYHVVSFPSYLFHPDEKFLAYNIAMLSLFISPFILFLFLKFLRTRVCMFIFSVIGAIFWGLLLTTNKKQNVWMITCVLFVSASEINLFTLIVFYINDIAPKEHTGAFSYIISLGYIFGSVLEYFCQIWLNFEKIAIIGCIICILYACFVWFLKESPDYNIEIKPPITYSGVKYKIIIVGFSLFLSSVMFIYFAPTDIHKIFKMNELPISDYAVATISRVLQLFGVIISFFIIRFFRTKIIWCFSTACVAFFQLLCFFSSVYNLGKKTSLVSFFCIYFVYGIGMWPIPWYYVSVIFLPAYSIVLPVIIAGPIFIIYWMELLATLSVSFGIFNFLIFAILTITSFIFGLFYFSCFDGNENDIYSDKSTINDVEKGSSNQNEEIDSSNQNEEIRNSNHDEEELGNNNHDEENDNNNNDEEKDNNNHDEENDNNNNDEEKDNNNHDEENDNNNNDEEKDNKLSNDVNNNPFDANLSN